MTDIWKFFSENVFGNPVEFVIRNHGYGLHSLDFHSAFVVTTKSSPSAVFKTVFEPDKENDVSA